jgi:UDP-glucose 4-epimerase
MQIAVTGSQSFIGRRFIALARDRGIAVTGIDSLVGDPGDVVMDIRDPQLPAAIAPGTDAVVHLAAISRDGDCRENPVAAFDVNVTGTLNVARACALQGVPQLVFASSEWVYGDAGTSVQREDDPIDVQRIPGEYALSKIAAERALAIAAARDLKSVTVLRFGIVYGPRPSNWSAVESLFDKVASDKPISVGSLATARRFIHVDDIATGILAALGRSGLEVFNISGDVLVTLGDIIATSSRVLGRQPQVTETAPGGVSIRNPDNAKAVATLGWRPAIDLETGLRTLAEDGALVLAR